MRRLIHLSTAPGLPREVVAGIQGELSRGNSQRVIAAMYGVSRDAVRKVAKEMKGSADHSVKAHRKRAA
jgi:predicted transcriptional regulator